MISGNCSSNFCLFHNACARILALQRIAGTDRGGDMLLVYATFRSSSQTF